MLPKKDIVSSWFLERTPTNIWGKYKSHPAQTTKQRRWDAPHIFYETGITLKLNPSLLSNHCHRWWKVGCSWNPADTFACALWLYLSSPWTLPELQFQTPDERGVWTMIATTYQACHKPHNIYEPCFMILEIKQLETFLCHLREPRSSNAPIAVSTPSTQILVSNTIFQWKKPGLLGEMSGSWAGA